MQSSVRKSIFNTAFCLATAATVHAGSTIGFETGDLSAVDFVLGQAEVVGSDIDLFQGPDFQPDWQPTEGTFMLAVDNAGGIDPTQVEDAFGLPAGQFDLVTDRVSAVGLTINARAGDRLQIDWNVNRDSDGGNADTDFDPAYIFANNRLYLLSDPEPGIGWTMSFGWKAFDVALELSGEQTIAFIVGEGKEAPYRIDSNGNPVPSFSIRGDDDPRLGVGYINTRLLVDNVRVVPTPTAASGLALLLPLIFRRNHRDSAV